MRAGRKLKNATDLFREQFLAKKGVHLQHIWMSLVTEAYNMDYRGEVKSEPSVREAIIHDLNQVHNGYDHNAVFEALYDPNKSQTRQVVELRFSEDHKDIVERIHEEANKKQEAQQWQ